MKVTMLGTGNAMVTKLYNTCYVLSEDGRCLLVDAGGGNTVLARLERAGIDWRALRDIIVTHKHVDHIMGIIWMMRMIGQHMSEGSYEGEARVYGHDEVIALIRKISALLLPEKVTKHFDERIHLIEVQDGETKNIIGHDVTFFDLHSTKAKQFGYRMELADGRTLACCGDETYNESERTYCENADWLFHEAFCLYGDREQFRPYKKHHSTARDAGRIAESLHVKNLLIYHTEDRTLETRRQRYGAEAAEEYRGRVFVPDDLETLELG
ncbi:MAG: MBL fold metallo-hydrolase [Lachnospiraceae bacterium]|nr:MBL fold metallo-hydrolase [Lachnospiraceae bacterium]MCI1327793.1 MBL fold metallo-hydrolase [Lachnospiraceae bacterium]